MRPAHADEQGDEDGDETAAAATVGEAAEAQGPSASPARFAPRRREVLFGALGALVGGGAGVALGYRFRTQLRALKLGILAYPRALPEGMGAFERDAKRIIAARNRETAETVAALKARYENAVYGRVRVWDLVEKLALCIDPTDRRLFCGSQLVHLQQILAAMERNGVTDPDMHVVAILHDLGKVLLAAGEAPEHVVGGTRRIEGGVEGAGLDGVVFQFGHGEFIYSRIRGHVPDHVAWVARYHNTSLTDAEPFMTAQEREWTETYLKPFRRFDADFVSPYYLPKIDLAHYRDLIERTFPQPLLV